MNTPQKPPVCPSGPRNPAPASTETPSTENEAHRGVQRHTASSITDDQLDALYDRVKRAEAARDRYAARLRQFAAEAHRRKWAHDPGVGNDGEPLHDPTFAALHRIGNELLAALHQLAQPAPSQPNSGEQP